MMIPRLIALALLIGIAPAWGQKVIATEQHRVKVTPVVQGLKDPWSVAFLPDGRLLINEKDGAMRVVREGKLLAQPVSGLPTVAARGQGGLLDVALHPQFAKNGLVYWSYSAGEGAAIGTEVARGRLACEADACRMVNVEVIFRQQPKIASGLHFGSRLVWDRAGNLFVTLGERGDKDEAQKLGVHLGKIVRITEDGKVPADNPFVNRAGAKPEIYSYGNRNVQGAALHPVTGELWAHEHGPQGGDEVNIIRAGKNYGWPVITYGVNYGTGTKIGEGTSRAGVEPPLWRWVPTSIAPCGMTFYTGDAFAKWRGNLFLGALRGEALVRLELDGDKVLREERIAGFGRVRDVRQGPDGNLYVLSETEGALFKLEPGV